MYSIIAVSFLSAFYSRLLPVFRSASQLQDVGLGVCAYAPTSSENYTMFCNNLNFAPAGPTVSYLILLLMHIHTQWGMLKYSVTEFMGTSLSFKVSQTCPDNTLCDVSSI